MIVNISIDKKTVYDELSKTTEYTGAKMDNDANAFERIMATDENLTDMDRFWQESAARATDALKTMLVKGADPLAVNYDISLELSASFDPCLIPSVTAALKSFFVKSMAAKWYDYTNKSESGSYYRGAEEMLLEAIRKLYSRRRPRSPRKYQKENIE